MARERVGQGANRPVFYWPIRSGPVFYWPIRSGERIGPGAKRLGTIIIIRQHRSTTYVEATSQLITRSSRHTVNSSPVNSSQTRLITQSTRHKRAHNKTISTSRKYLHAVSLRRSRNSAQHGRRNYRYERGYTQG